MSQIGRTVKNLEAPRPLKARQTHPHQVYEVQSIDELILLTENVASTMAAGNNNPESMSVLLANLRIHGPQLEQLSKDTLDRAFVTFRNASQDERLNIMTRLNLLELIELRAKSWQISDGLHTYYKHKATNVEPDATSNLVDSMAAASPTATQSASLLGPGELIRNSGKFPSPTKIPGKAYTKDEVVIRNADSGKVMGIKGRRVHMIEELSETIISFQRVNPGATSRLVQITGPSEDKINYAKQLIEDTIRRNASPVRLDSQGGGGSCSSLASSTSDDNLHQQQQTQANNSAAFRLQRNHSVGNGNIVGNYPPNPKHPITRVASVGSTPSGPTLLNSFSTNDAASLGEYKYTVNVGTASIKITGDCFDLVRVAKLVLDDYFSGQEFLNSLELGTALPLSNPITPSESKLNPFAAPMIPQSHQLGSARQSSFVDSGIGLNLLAQNQGNNDPEDEVFVVESVTEGSTTSSSTKSNSALSSPSSNNLTRSRRSNFVRKDSTPPKGVDVTASTKDSKQTDKVLSNAEKIRILYEYERLIFYAKSPHSWALPADWTRICEMIPFLAKNKNLQDDSGRFNSENHLKMRGEAELGRANSVEGGDEDPTAD